MGLRILAGLKVNDGPNAGTAAVLYESASNVPYPYMFEGQADAESFLRYYGEEMFRRADEPGRTRMFDGWVRGVRNSPDAVMSGPGLYDDILGGG